MIVGHIGGGQSDGYQAQRSLRLRRSASAYLTRTPGVSGNRHVWTYSRWVKRATLGVRQAFFVGGVADTGNNVFVCQFDASDRLEVFGATWGNPVDWSLVSSQVFRDPSAKLHIQVVVDTPQATAANRVKLYVNGVQITAFSTATYPALSYTTAVNAATLQIMGCSTPTLHHAEEYRTEEYLVDGKTLLPSVFGEFGSDYPQPKSPAAVRAAVAAGGGTRNGFGTNGFYLPFSDPTSLTTLMYDRSQSDTDTAGNNWTASNISLTAGSTYDSMLDVPMGGGGNERGNYATLNPLNPARSTLSNANLTASGSTDLPTITPDSGTWYFERGGVAQTWTPPAAFPAGSGDYNFGQRPWQSTGPTGGQKALHTGNLTNTTPITSGSFTGNVSADGPPIWCNGTPETLTINGNAVTWGTHADKTAGGFKLRTSSASYNSSGSNTWTATYLSPSSKSAFKYQLAKANP